jgi:hypothetical protein
MQFVEQALQRRVDMARGAIEHLLEVFQVNGGAGFVEAVARRVDRIGDSQVRHDVAAGVVSRVLARRTHRRGAAARRSRRIRRLRHGDREPLAAVAHRGRGFVVDPIDLIVLVRRIPLSGSRKRRTAFCARSGACRTERRNGPTAHAGVRCTDTIETREPARTGAVGCMALPAYHRPMTEHHPRCRFASLDAKRSGAR